MTDNTLTTLQEHARTVVAYIQNKFNEISSIGYQVMTEDEQTIGIKAFNGH